MNKLSVFKFAISDNRQEQAKIKEICETYAKSRGMFYDEEKHCYRTGIPIKKEQAANVAKSVAISLASAAAGGTFGHAFVSVEFGFEYYIESNELIVKAYILIKGKKKKFIHSTFNNSPAGTNYYNDLKQILFKKLENAGAKYTSKEIEKER